MAKYGARLRGWRTTESNGSALRMSYVPNGNEGCTSMGLTQMSHFDDFFSHFSNNWRM